MKILLIHHKIPYPLRSGWDKAIYNLIRTLSTVHRVTLIAPVDELTTPKDVKYIRKLCDNLVTIPVKSRTLAMRKRGFLYWWRFLRVILFRIPGIVTENYYSAVAKQVRKWCQRGEYDLVQAASLATARYLQFVPSTQIRVLGPIDESIGSARDSMLFANQWRKKIVSWLEYRAWLHYQPEVCLKNDWILFYSVQDLHHFKNLVNGLPNGRHLPVAVEVDDVSRISITSSFRKQESNSLVFVGGLGPFFNQDAVLFFYQKIFPLILSHVSNAKFYIVGENPPSYIKNLEHDGHIIVTGKVPDVRPYIERAAVYVAPIRAGTGLKTKIIEALKLGKAIVATSVAVAGLWDLGDDVIRVCDVPESFADEVVELLRNDERRFSLGMKAHDLYERSYSFGAVAPNLLGVYEEIEESLFEKHHSQGWEKGKD